MFPSEFKDELARAFSDACRKAADAPPAGAPVLEKPRDAAHGDFCCPLALALARQMGDKPRRVADSIVAALTRPQWVDDVQIAGPGFINIVVNKTAKTEIVREVLSRGEEFGCRAARAETVLLEFVSANPTGPLHVGHGRNCAYGDSLANILTARGYDVRREYYVNDSGRQMRILVASVWLRHWKETLPEGAYQGDYLRPVADSLTEEFSRHAPPPDTLREELRTAADSDAAADALVRAARAAITPAATFDALQRHVCELMLENVIKQDMRKLGVDVDNVRFFHESRLYEDGLVETALEQMQKNGGLCEEDGALWFVASAYGDEKNRVVRRANGELTYFAADIAYHADKLARPRPAGNNYRLLNVLGADHHGYVPRLQALVRALGYPAEAMETQIIQLVALSNNGVRQKMSTRAGQFVSLREVVDDIGADAARYFYVSRKNDKHLDFDLSVAKARNNNNPVYYIQYANARINGVFRKWGGDKKCLADARPATLSTDAAALVLCDTLIDYPEAVERAAEERAPHLLAAHLHALATALHGWYETTRMLAGEEEETQARLALLLAAQTTLGNGARLLGFSLPETL